MRVMYINPTGQLGGAETSLLAMLASVRGAQPSWALHLVTAGEGPLNAAAGALGITTTVQPFPPALARLGEHGAHADRSGYLRLAARFARAASTLPGYVGRLRREIRSFRPDIIHTNGLKMHLLAGWAARSVPLVWHLHDYLGSRPLTARLLRRNASRCSVLVANSMSVARDATATLGNGIRVVPILNAVDLDRFLPTGDRADLDRLAGLPAAPAGTIRVGLLGTFARWKGHGTFLSAVAQLPGDLPIRAYVIGDALYQTDGSQHSGVELRQMAASLGIADRVGFTGFIERSDAALRALDIVVHASTSPEPFGLVIAEAMACGRAVIVSGAGGAAELVSPDVDALTHTPGNAGELAARIATLAADASLRARIGTAGRATAERAFDRARLARELIPVYHDALSSRLSGISASSTHLLKEQTAERTAESR
jgi:glycosyltransferase involved in cell wall biosynthesis